ncbi:MAG: proline dehydrogenase family protein [Chitinophagaceae bacterium]|nr:proline dehydrogenase family protein [Chitinophagaceae bacterium]
MNLNFQNTENAFAYKSDKELKGARFLFSSMSKSWLVKLGIWATPLALRWNLPVKGLIRKTIFRQFVGGETLKQTTSVADHLAKFNVQIILDYGVEGGQGEDKYQHAMDEFIRVINFASGQPNIPFMSIKVTGMARFGLLEKIHAQSDYNDVVRGGLQTDHLSAEEKAEWQRACDRMLNICKVAVEKKVGVMIDAEDSWIQHPVDALTTQMMMQFNKENPVVYNTAQLYRHDRLQYIKDVNEFAKASGFICAFKLVRGAYMEKERARAAEMGYPSPINADKAATDKMYDDAVRYCVDPQNNMYTLVGSHNEESNRLAAELIDKYGMPHNTDRVYFSQLYGMSDNITFNLAKAGYNSTKYLPFGPIHDVIPYLMRRAEENSSLGGQTGRELNLIREEIKRRGI